MLYTYKLKGNTYENKNDIYRLGFKWEPTRKVWFKHSQPLDMNNSRLQSLIDNGVIIEEHRPNDIQYYRKALQARNDLSFSKGDSIEIKAWVAKQIAEQENLELCFRNLQLTEVYAESAKAIQCKIKFVSKVANSCHLCGRNLDTEISRATGIGPVCAKKLKLDRGTYEDASQCLKFLNEYAEGVGEIGPVWIPKSQMISNS